MVDLKYEDKLMSTKIATWNVNSLRVRLPQILAWLAQHQPDILALQETKVIDALFPKAEIEDQGYHVIYAGEKSYNGVALLSKKPCIDIVTDFPNFTDPSRRIIGGTIDSLRILNLYVPNGGSLDSEKYPHKLNWLQHLHIYIQQQLKEHTQLIILGDFNIAPRDQDVYDIDAMRGQLLVSDPERAALQKILDLGMIDVFQKFEHPAKTFSWWDYRFGAFRRNIGMRLDLILANIALTERCQSCEVDKEARKASPPSDHAPVVAVFEI